MKKIYKVTAAQLTTLQNGGSITVGDTTYTYETGADVAYVVVDPSHPEYVLSQTNNNLQLKKNGTVVSDITVAFASASGYSTKARNLEYDMTATGVGEETLHFNLYDGGTISGETIFETKVQATGGVMAGADSGIYFTPNTNALRMYATSTNNYVVNLDCPHGQLFQFADNYNTSNRSLFPGTTKEYDLGSSGAFWQNLYLSGDLSDGTNSISVANIASKEYVAQQINALTTTLY